MEQDTDTLTFTITPPTDITYLAYKVFLRNDDFTIEYTTYENILVVPKPDVKGTYDIYCIGYVNEGEITSFESNIITLSLTGIYTEWPKVSPGAETYSKAEIDTLTKVDTELDPNSQHPVTNAAIYAVLGDVEKTMQNIIGGE